MHLCSDIAILSRPTALDIHLAAHILVLLAPKYPEPVLQNLVTESYPKLVAHAIRVRTQLMTTLPHSSHQSTPTSFSLSSLLPRLQITRRGADTTSKEDVQFARIRWGFFGLALGSVFAYFAVVGSPIRIIVKTPGRQERFTQEDKQDLDGNADDD